MKKLYGLMTFVSLAGLVASFWQLLDKLELLKHPASNLTCNLNSVFNCSSVLKSHQYEVFGFPNAMIGIIMFTFFLTIAVVLLTGSHLVNRVALACQGLALFMLGFMLWFLFQSTYRINAICLFCLIIGPSVLLINVVLLRHNQKLMPAWLQKFMTRGGDIFVWSVLFLGVALAIALKFAS